MEKFSKLDPILNHVHKTKIQLNDDEKQGAVRVLKVVESKVMEKFKMSNSVLKEMTNGITYRGSYFGGVKVSKADEFDIDIMLKLPFNYSSIVIAIEEPGYISINIKDAYNKAMKNPTWAAKYADLKKFMDDKGYLTERSIRQEIERILDERGCFPLTLEKEKVAQIRMRKNGPAFTFEVSYEGSRIDIDFVFALYMDSSVPTPRLIRKYPMDAKSPNKYWLAIPKPTDNPRSWRISFPHQEAYILNGNNNLKSIYRYLKCLRDVQKWKLASYHIATIFLWESDENRPDFWKNSIGTLFVHMLKLLRDKLKEGKIQFFWDSRCNLLQDFGAATLNNMVGQIDKMLKQIQTKNDNIDNPQLLKEFILNKMFAVKEEENNDFDFEMVPLGNVAENKSTQCVLS